MTRRAPRPSVTDGGRPCRFCGATDSERELAPPTLTYPDGYVACADMGACLDRRIARGRRGR